VAALLNIITMAVPGCFFGELSTYFLGTPIGGCFVG